MLSISPVYSGQGHYYLNLSSVGDYYLDAGSPAGFWMGTGAARLGLTGRVTREDFKRLLLGYSPTGEPLVQNAGSPKRLCALDGTFSCPKSVSILRELGSPHVRLSTDAASWRTVEALINYWEAEVACVRRGRRGTIVEPAGLIAVAIPEYVNRNSEPQQHVHLVLVNAGVTAAGRTAALHTRPFFRHKMAGGALARAQLSNELERRLGFESKRIKTWFEIRGVPKSLITELSSRRAEILSVAPADEAMSATAAEQAALATRRGKRRAVSHAQLRQSWWETARLHGLTEAGIAALVRRPPKRHAEREYQAALREAVDHLTASQAHFARKDLLYRVAIAAQGRGLDAGFIRLRLTHDLERSPEFIRLGERRREARYTTPSMLAVEKELFDTAWELRKGRGRMLSHKRVEKLIARYSVPRSPVLEEIRFHGKQLARQACKQPTEQLNRARLRKEAAETLNSEQAAAVRHLTTTPGRIKILTGLAGTGKTFTLRTCREAWEQAGYRVVGAALSGRAAEELRNGAGIQATTLATLERRVKPSATYRAKHVGKQLWRAALRRPTFTLKPLRINRKTILVIDEAGMIGTRQMARILEQVRAHGGKVVLVGDPKQLQPPTEAGGALASLARRLGHVELEKIARQREEADRHLVRATVQGDSKLVLRKLAERGLLAVAEDRQQAREQLVSDWFEHAGRDPHETLIFCGTNADARDLNRRCQQERAGAGLLNINRSISVGGARLLVGDRVLLTKTCQRLKVNNGEIATLIAVSPLRRAVAVQRDDGQRIVIPLRKYKHRFGRNKGKAALCLGYAVTAHKGQGTTVENAYVLLAAGSSMQDRELSYVQISRARGGTRVYTDKLEAGPDLTRLSQQMARSCTKDLAHDVRASQRAHAFERGMEM